MSENRSSFRSIAFATAGVATAISGAVVQDIDIANQQQFDTSLGPQQEIVRTIDEAELNTMDLGNGTMLSYDQESKQFTITVPENNDQELSFNSVQNTEPTQEDRSAQVVSDLNGFLNGKDGSPGLVDGFSEYAEAKEKQERMKEAVPPKQDEVSRGPPDDEKTKGTEKGIDSKMTFSVDENRHYSVPESSGEKTEKSEMSDEEFRAKLMGNGAESKGDALKSDAELKNALQGVSKLSSETSEPSQSQTYGQEM